MKNIRDAISADNYNYFMKSFIEKYLEKKQVINYPI